MRARDQHACTLQCDEWQGTGLGPDRGCGVVEVPGIVTPDSEMRRTPLQQPHAPRREQIAEQAHKTVTHLIALERGTEDRRPQQISDQRRDGRRRFRHHTDAGADRTGA